MGTDANFVGLTSQDKAEFFHYPLNFKKLFFFKWKFEFSFNKFVSIFELQFVIWFKEGVLILFLLFSVAESIKNV